MLIQKIIRVQPPPPPPPANLILFSPDSKLPKGSKRYPPTKPQFQLASKKTVFNGKSWGCTPSPPPTPANLCFFLTQNYQKGGDILLQKTSMSAGKQGKCIQWHIIGGGGEPSLHHHPPFPRGLPVSSIKCYNLNMTHSIGCMAKLHPPP